MAKKAGIPAKDVPTNPLEVNSCTIDVRQHKRTNFRFLYSIFIK